MKNSTVLKNELIFQYAAGTASLPKSLMASTYLFLNSRESIICKEFEEYCGEELKNTALIKPEKLIAEDCISEPTKINNLFETISLEPVNPVIELIDNLKDIKWNKVFSGFYEFSFNLSNKEKTKLIKMDPGARVPLHSHNGKEYTLVLEGSFSDEYGHYTKGNLQVNDSMIKHTPIACNKEGCICLTLTEKELVFFGPFAPILNIITFLKSLFSKSQ
jgi:putative transcriptional regulator